MKLRFSHAFDAPREGVWRALLDPGVMSRIIPGVERFETVADDTYDATLKVGLPTVKGEYNGRVAIRDKVRGDDHDSYVLGGEGRGAQGWAKGEARIELSDLGEGTRMAVDAEVQVGGRIAGVGQRMIEGVARMMADEFFTAFDRELAGTRATGAGTVAFFFRAVIRFVRRTFASRSLERPS